MADLSVRRGHALGLARARKLAFTWAEQVEERFGMECTYEEGVARDVVSFSRSGVNGTLIVTKSEFELEARLGLLMSVFKDRIEGEIVKNLDALLAKKPRKR